jgi:hemerythrin superfamily protein
MSVTSAHDVIGLLLEDHQKVEQLFDRFRTEGNNAQLFNELTNTLVRHEVAEEEIIYPEVRKRLSDGERLANERIAEQAEAEERLAKMEKEGTDSSDFGEDLVDLREAVLAHAEKEERLVFTPLAGVLDLDRRRQLGERYERAKAAAPTHPHPHAPDTPPGNLLVGPIAAFIDRVRDAMRKA